MTKAYSYVRFSSKKQELGDSLRRQVKAAKDYAAKHQLQLVDKSFEDLGVSAYKGANALEGALGAFLAAVDAAIIEPGSFLLVESLDRISRQQVEEALELFLSIIRRGITIVTLMDGHVFSREKIREDKGLSLIISIMLMIRAHEESSTKGKRVAEAWANKRDSGKVLTKNGPAWMQFNDDTGEFDLIPERVQLVQDIFAMALEGGGMGGTSIARLLNERHVPPLDPLKNKSAMWSSQNVNYLLRNRAVIGDFNPKRRKNDALDALHPDRRETLRTDYYKPIIDPVVFAMVQEKMDGRKHTGGGSYRRFTHVLSNVALCECGSNMVLKSSNPEYPYLKCTKSYNNAGCDAEAVPYNIVERALFEYLMDIEEQDFDHKKVMHDPRVVLRAELAEKQHRHDELLKFVMNGGVRIPMAITASMNALEDEIKDLTKTLAGMSEPSPIKERAANARSLLNEYERFSTDKGRYDNPQYIALRERLKNGLVGLVDEVFFLKREKHFNGPNEQTTFRYAVVKGPLISALLDEHGKPLDGVAPSLYEDGGFLLEYELTAWGDKKSRRRAANRAG